MSAEGKFSPARALADRTGTDVAVALRFRISYSLATRRCGVRLAIPVWTVPHWRDTMSSPRPICNAETT